MLSGKEKRGFMGIPLTKIQLAVVRGSTASRVKNRLSMNYCQYVARAAFLSRLADHSTDAAAWAVAGRWGTEAQGTH